MLYACSVLTLNSCICSLIGNSRNSIFTLHILLSQKLDLMEGNSILLDQEVQVCGIYGG